MKLILRIMLLFLIFNSTIIKAQNNVGIGTIAPNTSSLLELQATDKGLLIPRVALTATNSNAPIGAGIANSLLVFNTATAGVAPNNVTPGYYYWNGANWVRFMMGNGDAWVTTGNNGTLSGNNFVGTTDAQALDFRTNNTIRFRVANGNQVHAVVDGTAALPFYSFANNNGMGMYRAGANILSFATTGLDRMRVNAAGQVLVNVLVPTEPNQFETTVSAGANWSINGYNTTNNGGGAGFFQNSSVTNGFNSTECVTAGSNAGIWGWNTAAGTGVRGTVNNVVVGWAGFFQGDVGCTGIYIGSDRKWKKNIVSLKDENTTLDKVMRLNPIRYSWDVENNIAMGFNPEKINFGFIAQDLLNIFPELVTTKKSIPNPKAMHKTKAEADNVQGYLMVDYISIIPILTKAIQEQQQIIENLELRVKLLESK